MRSLTCPPLALAALAVAIGLPAGQTDLKAQEGSERLDFLFVNGTVVDGSGSARYRADVGVAGDSIEVIGQDLESRYDADRVIDIEGRFIAPGYIDVHTHAAGAVLGDDPERKAALNLLYQGITTVGVGADGRHSTRFADRREGQISRQYEYIDANPFGMNVFLLAGHNNIRMAVLGEDDFRRFSSPAEMREMATHVRRYMEEGALGLSLGLEYASGRYSDTEELVHLARELAAYDERAVVIAHERATGAQHRYYIPSEHDAEGLYRDRFVEYPGGWDVIDYVKEGIEIAERSGIVYDFTHFKVTHRPYWGASAEIIGLIEAARDRGVKVYAEHMPFTNSGNSPMDLDIIPEKYFEAPEDSIYPYDELRRVLDDPVRGAMLRADIGWQIDKHGGGASVDIIDSDSHPELIGRSLDDLARKWGMRDLVDVLLRVKEEGDVRRPNGARFRSRQTLSLEDVANFARTEWFGTVTDGGVAGLEGGFVQPRLFGSFTKKIELLVKQAGVISLEHAIRAGTGLPAEMMSLPDRGLLREGYKADLQVFDLEELEVEARWTLTGSRAYSEGVRYVLVNGEIALDDREPTYNLAGRSIRNQEAWGR